MPYAPQTQWSEFYKHLNTKEWYRDYQDKLAVSSFDLHNSSRLPMLENILETYKPSDFKDIPAKDVLGENIYTYNNWIRQNNIKISNGLVDQKTTLYLISDVFDYYGVTGENIIKMHWYFISLYDSSAENLSMGSGDFVAYKNLLESEREKMNLNLDVKRDRPHMNEEMFQMIIISTFFGGIKKQYISEWTWKEDWWEYYPSPFYEGVLEEFPLVAPNALNMIKKINKELIGLENITNYVGNKLDSPIIFMNWMDTSILQTFK